MAWHKQDLLRNIERIAVGMAITRPDGTVESANRYLCEMLEVRIDELLDLPFPCFETGMAADAQHGLRRQRDTDNPGWHESARVRTGRGKNLDVLHATHPLHDDAGAAAQFVHLLQYLHDER